jgi:hypothetical protein
MDSIQFMVGELRGEVSALRTDVRSLKTSVDALTASENQRKGGWVALVSVAAVVSGGVTFLVNALKLRV